jgi:hypothetical protein
MVRVDERYSAIVLGDVSLPAASVGKARICSWWAPTVGDCELLMRATGRKSY